MGLDRHPPILREFLRTPPLLAGDPDHRKTPLLQVVGPNLHEVDKPENLNTSSQRLYNLFFKPVFSEQELLYANGWVDVRDVAAAHIAALEKAEAGNERIIVSAPSVPLQEFTEAAKKVAVSLGIEGVQTGIANYDRSNVKDYVTFSEEKRDRILGIKITSLDDSVRDSLVDFKARGWIPAPSA